MITRKLTSGSLQLHESQTFKVEIIRGEFNSCAFYVLRPEAFCILCSVLIILKILFSNLRKCSHQVKSDRGEFEFCKILCRGGRWRGPVCRVKIKDIKGR